MSAVLFFALVVLVGSSRKLALGACDRELELPRQPAKLPGGSLRGGWSTGALLPRCAIAFGEGGLRCPLFGALRGRRRGRSGRRPECSRERGPARSARFFWARCERVACFSSGAHGPLPSLQLSLALSLSPCKVSLRRPLFMCGARCCASRSIKARAPRAGNENSGIAAREGAARCSSHPGVWVPAWRSFRCMLLRSL